MLSVLFWILIAILAPFIAAIALIIIFIVIAALLDLTISLAVIAFKIALPTILIIGSIILFFYLIGKLRNNDSRRSTLIRK